MAYGLVQPPVCLEEHSQGLSAIENRKQLECGSFATAPRRNLKPIFKKSSSEGVRFGPAAFLVEGGCEWSLAGGCDENSNFTIGSNDR